MPLLVVVILLLASTAVPAQQMFASSVARVYTDDGDDERLAVTRDRLRPSNVEIPAAYDDDIERMLRSSPTFRAQCDRIARAAHLHVVIQQSLSAPPQSAVTHITRQSGGHLEADVEVGPLADRVLLIAHEFEHIIEQLDGVDLPALAERQATGVRADPKSGHFETERAIAMGRRVAREVSSVVARR
jgi:hypothetical protein